MCRPWCAGWGCCERFCAEGRAQKGDERTERDQEEAVPSSPKAFDLVDDEDVGGRSCRFEPQTQLLPECLVNVWLSVSGTFGVPKVANCVSSGIQSSVKSNRPSILVWLMTGRSSTAVCSDCASSVMVALRAEAARPRIAECWKVRSPDQPRSSCAADPPAA